MDKKQIDLSVREFVEGTVQILPNLVDKIYLYGSCARGDYQDDSDVDIMVVLNCPQDAVYGYFKRLVSLISDIDLRRDVVLSCQFCTKSSWREKNTYLPYYKNILQDGVVYYG